MDITVVPGVDFFLFFFRAAVVEVDEDEDTAVAVSILPSLAVLVWWNKQMVSLQRKFKLVRSGFDEVPSPSAPPLVVEDNATNPPS
jgi:hypothetical protein